MNDTIHKAKKTALISKCYQKRLIFYLGGLFVFLLIFASFSIAADPGEFELSEVDSPPKLIRQMPTKYPAEAKKSGVTGRVVVRCLISVNGKISKQEIAESDPPGVFDQSAMDSLKNWQFRPGLKGGQLVNTWVKIPLKYQIE